ncbi:MAG: hypothetical protein KKA73_00300 [Chloroflexi bacterium]|nr:hypothetical protein [Chloroflexota bacterium]MBU1746102.1 hypothetical protein [Chloroflexota bacterium]
MIDQVKNRLIKVGPYQIFLLENYRNCPAGRVYQGEPGQGPYVDYPTPQAVLDFLATIHTPAQTIANARSELRALGWSI